MIQLTRIKADFHSVEVSDPSRVEIFCFAKEKAPLNLSRTLCMTNI